MLTNTRCYAKIACKPCVEARGLSASVLDKRVKLAGMNEFHAAAKQPDARVVNF
jgi:sulfur relay (sulfurtransferase) complex TusBCD TusD component (DsrE family)